MGALLTVLFNGLATLLGNIASKFFRFAVTRGPVLLVAIGLIVGVSALYLSAMHDLTVGIGQTIPTVVSNVWSWVMPGNAVPCLFAVLTARIVRWSYQKYEKLVVFKAKSLTTN